MVLGEEEEKDLNKFKISKFSFMQTLMSKVKGHVSFFHSNKLYFLKCLFILLMPHMLSPVQMSLTKKKKKG